jgi:hypothetical protein
MMLLMLLLMEGKPNIEGPFFLMMLLMLLLIEGKPNIEGPFF